MDKVSVALLSARSEVRFKIAMLKMQRKEEHQAREEAEAQSLRDRVDLIIKNHPSSKKSFKERYKNAQFNKAYY